MEFSIRDLFPCFCKETNLAEKELQRRAKVLRRTIPILVLGTSECGKSTVLKQIERRYNRNAFEEKRQACAKLPKINLLMATWQLLEARDAFGYLRDNAEREYEFKEKTDFLSPRRVNVFSPPKAHDEEEAFRLFPKIADDINAIWSSPSVVKTLERRAEFYMLDSAEYFKSRIDDVKMPNYIPTDEDVLKARKQTQGIVEIEVDAKLARDSVVFKITDVGGQKAERKYWGRIMSGDEMASILYVFSLSDYNLDVPDRKEKHNRMLENTEIFSSIINKEEFKTRNIIVFLNKTDIFEEKLKHVPLTVCYPDYPDSNRDPDAAMTYIENQIRSQDQNATLDNGTPARELVFHRTHATDPLAFRKVVETVLASMQAENLRLTGLLM